MVAFVMSMRSPDSCLRQRAFRASRKPQVTSARGRLARTFASSATASEPVPVPTSIKDISNGNILGYGADLAEDHPGFGDKLYTARRQMISEMAKAHQIENAIDNIDYLPEERETWALVLDELKQGIPQWACSEYITAFDQFGFQADHVPQLQEVQEVLQAATGWSIRPTAGLMHPRDFLNGLAFKTFHSTQYMRHPSNPMYTPEPDVVHEILGHVPMMMDPAYCEMLQEIGKASLGASKEDIWKLTKVYWYTVEFGVVREDDSIKAFGAGILSSFGELEWMGTGKAEIVPLDLSQPLPKMSYKDGFQKRYYSLGSFAEGAQMLKDFSKTMASSA